MVVNFISVLLFPLTRPAPHPVCGARLLFEVASLVHMSMGLVFCVVDW